MRFIEFIVSAPLFILSTGLLFNEEFRKKAVFVGLAAIIAAVSSLLTVREIYNYFWPTQIVSDQRVQSTLEDQDKLKRELDVERAERQRLAAELEKQRNQDQKMILTKDTQDSDKQHKERLKEMGMGLATNVYQLLMKKIEQNRNQ